MRSLTASISRSHAQNTLPVRRTKLAYVNSAAKPPRDVLRKQMKNRSVVEMMQHSPAANGKRSAAGAVLTGSAVSPRKRHSTTLSVSSPSQAESSTPQKGAFQQLTPHFCSCECRPNRSHSRSCPLPYLTFGVGRLLHLPSAEAVSVRPNAQPRCNHKTIRSH